VHACARASGIQSRGTGYNESRGATSEYEMHNGGLPGKASGLVRETACYGPKGTQAIAVYQSTHTLPQCNDVEWRAPE